MKLLRMRLLKWIATLFVFLDGALIAGGTLELGAHLLQRIA
jgi:hypothetical protein